MFANGLFKFWLCVCVLTVFDMLYKASAISQKHVLLWHIPCSGYFLQMFLSKTHFYIFHHICSCLCSCWVIHQQTINIDIWVKTSILPISARHSSMLCLNLVVFCCRYDLCLMLLEMMMMEKKIFSQRGQERLSETHFKTKFLVEKVSKPCWQNLLRSMER